MKTPSRRLYGFILSLHPAAFRKEFGREMALDFEDALHTHSFHALWRDVLWSLARQWTAHLLPSTPTPGFAPTPSLLAGNYVMISDATYTLPELGRGLTASVTMLALCCLGMSTTQKAIRLRFASESNLLHSSVLNSPQTSTAAAPEPPAIPAVRPCDTLPALADAQPTPELRLFHSSGPLPSYEVATVKLIDPDAASAMVKLPPGVTLSPLTLRRYIMDAFGATYAAQVIGGPDWLNKDPYLIRGKIADDLQARLQNMSWEDRRSQTRMMAQCLLAERFRIQAHFETRVLPVYEFVPAKNGLKLTEVAAPPEHKFGDPPPPPPHPGNPLPPGTSMTMFNSSGSRVFKARAITLDALARGIGPEAGDRPIVNHTGFNGYFDVTDLTWAPLTSADTAPDAPSLTRTLQKTLGVDLVPAKAPIEVLVIDAIQRPSEN